MKSVRTPDGKSTHGVRSEARLHLRVIMTTYCGITSRHGRLETIRMGVDCETCLKAIEKEKLYSSRRPDTPEEPR